MSALQKLSGFELKKIESELQDLVDSKVDKIYVLAKKDLLFNFHKTGVGKKALRIILPNLLYFTNRKYQPPQNPPGFCTFLRKYLDNSRLRSVEMVNGERILDFTFETKDEKFHLFFEFFDKGNAILTDEKLKIKSPLENQNWADRTIRGGVDYVYPKKDFNLFNLDFETFKKNIQDEILKSLTLLGIGKEYSVDILKRVKLDPKSKNLTDDELEQVFNSVKKTLAMKSDCSVYGNRLFVTEVSSLKGKEFTKYPTISEGFDSLIEPVQVDINEKANQKTAKLQKIIAMQTERKTELETQSALDQRKGELLYENYPLVSDILLQINTARKKLSWDEIKEKLKGHKIIKKIDSAKGIITIELE
ncbi:NFACT family protein [Candidatus Woesearchaeota archaeon]|nr:NFACT family protein [Candidatus Woesearchaeota archaeon]